MITVRFGTWWGRKNGEESGGICSKGAWGQFWFCFLEIRRVVFPNFRVAQLFVTEGPSKENWGESCCNFLPATSPGTAKRKSTLPREAQAGAGSCGTPPFGPGTRGGGLAPDAGRGKPLPCTPPLANGAWSCPPAAQAVLSPAANRRPQGPPTASPSSLPAAPAAPWRPARPARAGPPHTRPRGQAPAGTVSEPRGGSLAAQGAPSPQLTCALDPGAAPRGAGRRRSRPADSNFVALRTAQSSLPRGAGGAARAVTQQLARWRAGPCSRPPARPGPLARSPLLCVLVCRKKSAAVCRACTPLGKARSSRVVSVRKKCGQACFRAGHGK